MTDKLTTYYDEARSALAKNPSGPPLEKLRLYHEQRVAEFQHERLIHLLVTMFFGALALASYAAVVTVLIFPVLQPMAFLAGLLAIILTIVEGCYIWHYYRLENGTQKLYRLTDKLYR